MATFAIQFVARPVPGSIALGQFWLVLMSLPVFALAAGANHLYQARANSRPLEGAANVIKAAGAGMIWMLVVGFALQHADFCGFGSGRSLSA